jgi:hypothetical protein
MIRCTEEFWRAVKVAAVLEDKLMRELCEEALVEFHHRRREGRWGRNDYVAKPKRGLQKSMQCRKSLVQEVGKWGIVDNVEKTTVWYSAVREHLLRKFDDVELEEGQWV